MGWFLTSTKKRKPRKTAKRSGWQPRQWDPERTLRLLTFTAWMLVLAVVALGWTWGEKKLKTIVGRSHHDAPLIVLQKVPVWMPPQVSDDLFKQLRAALEGDPFNSLSLQEASAALEASPWVRHVQRVGRVAGDKVEVLAEYRQPVAMVLTNQELHLVDRDGFRLPLVYAADSGADRKTRLPVITGVTEKPPRAGELWPGADVRAGLKLAGIVSTQSWGASVRAVDVTNYGGRLRKGDPQLVLMTTRGQVRWGRAPGDEQFYEPSTAKKIKSIESIIRKTDSHSIDAGGQVVDVFSDAVLIHSSSADADAIRYTLGQ